MKNKIIKVVVACLVMLTSVFSSVRVFAEEEVVSSLIVSPPTERMILVPGERYKGAFKISSSNASKNALKYTVSVGSFSQVKDEHSKDDYGTVDHISVSSYNQIMDWIVLDKTSGVVEPNTTDTVGYTINVPENAPAGGQYATIIFRDETRGTAGGDGNVAIQNIVQFASVVYAEVAGETREIGAIKENSVPTISFGSPLVTSSLVRNDGNVHTDAKYVLQIYPLFSDHEVYSNEEEPMKSLILPESERYNTQTWEEAPMVGIFRVKQTVSIFGDVSTVEKIVIICPLWLLFIIIIGIIGIIWWLISRSRNRKKD